MRSSGPGDFPLTVLDAVWLLPVNRFDLINEGHLVVGAEPGSGTCLLLEPGQALFSLGSVGLFDPMPRTAQEVRVRSGRSSFNLFSLKIIQRMNCSVHVPIQEESMNQSNKKNPRFL